MLQEDVARLAAQARTLALRAGLGGLVARQFIAHGHRVGLAEAALEVGDDAFEGVRPLHRTRLAAAALAHAFGLVGELDVVGAAAEEQHLARAVGQVLEGGLDVEAVVPGDAFEQRVGVAVAPVPALHGPGSQAQAGEGDDTFGVHCRHLTEAVAGRAGAHRAVEAEEARLEFAERVSAHRAAELAAEQVLTPGVHFQRDGAAIGDAQAGFEALGQALLEPGRRAAPKAG